MPQRKVRRELPTVSTIFTKRFRGQIIHAKVVAVDPQTGRVALEVKGQTFPTLSAAAKALTGAETNGWRFWGLNKGE